MNMHVRFTAIPFGIVLMPVVRVMDMLVGVLQFFVDVRMLVMFRKVQPDADRHQSSGQPEIRSRALAQHGERQSCAEERRHREIGAGPRRAQMPQRHNEEHEAYAVAEESEQTCADPAGGRGQR